MVTDFKNTSKYRLVMGYLSIYLQHSIGIDATCRETPFPPPCGMCTRNTSRTRVFFRPMSVSPFRSSISEFRSFRIPAQSILEHRHFYQTFTASLQNTYLEKYLKKDLPLMLTSTTHSFYWLLYVSQEVLLSDSFCKKKHFIV